jgi:hypothetical protein
VSVLVSVGHRKGPDIPVSRAAPKLAGPYLLSAILDDGSVPDRYRAHSRPVPRRWHEESSMPNESSSSNPPVQPGAPVKSPVRS